MGEVDRTTSRTAAALISAVAVLFAWPAVAAAAPPVCADPPTLTVQPGATQPFTPTCSTESTDPIVYVTADPQPQKGDVVEPTEGRFEYTADLDAAGPDQFGFTATAGGESSSY